MSDFFTQLAEFHFLRPLWLWGLLPLGLILLSLRRRRVDTSAWQGLVNESLLPRLLSHRQGQQLPRLRLLGAGWLITLLALAGPSWQQKPQPVFDLPQARVIVLDMSLSMYAEDLQPNRLTRLRYKILDLLEYWQGGDTGLVAFAKDAHVISPLSSDRRNLQALLPSLSPSIMPRLGSEPQLGIASAIELLQSAGFPEGEIWLFTDAITENQAKQITSLLAQHSYRLKILAIGTPAGAPMRLPNGDLFKSSTGEVVAPGLRIAPIRQLAAKTGATLAILAADNSDLEHLLSDTALPELRLNTREAQNPDSQSSQWHDSGYLLVLLLLPLALFAFRRGVYLSATWLIMSMAMLPALSPPAQAFDWSSLLEFKNQAQRGHDAFLQDQHQQAVELFEDSDWLGSSYYRQGEYQQAIEAYAQKDTAHSWYNRGNALAQLGDYPAAISAYEQALSRQPEFPQATKNKALLEQLLAQQEQEQQEGENSQQPDPEQEQTEQQPQPSEAPNSGQNTPEQQQDTSQGSSSPDGSQTAENSPQTTPDPSEASDDEQQPEDSASSQGNDGAEPAEDGKDETDKQNPGERGESDDAEQGQRAAASEQTDGEIDAQNAREQERWLEQIPDDPSVLLRNKMRLEYQRRRQQGLFQPGADGRSAREESQPW